MDPAVPSIPGGPERLGYVPALDGLRGVAVLLVVGFHSFNWPRNGGDLGVGFFFVLSGFLITTLLLEEFAKTESIRLRRFYARRALRLFPLLYFVLVVVGCSIPLMRPGERSRYAHSLLWCAVYAGDFFGMTGRFNSLAPALGHLWSLAVEEQFYLVWPAVLLWLLARRNSPIALLRYVGVFVVAAIVIRVGLLADGKTIWTLPSTHADALLAGCGLAIVRRQGRLVGWADSPTLRAAALGAFSVAVVAPLVRPTVGLGTGYMFIELLGMGLLLVALGGRAPVLGSRPVVYCGRISYGLYLIHPVLLVAFNAGLADVPHWPRVVLAVVAAFLVAAASRRWFEGYFLALKHRFQASSSVDNR